MLQEKQEFQSRERGNTKKPAKLKPLLKKSIEDEETDEIEELEVKLNNAELPNDAQKVAMKELKRLKKMSPQMPEYPMLRHYLGKYKHAWDQLRLPWFYESIGH